MASNCLCNRQVLFIAVLVCFLLVVCSLLFDAVILVHDGIGALLYPYELDYGEGPVQNQMGLITSAGNGFSISAMYTSVREAPFVVANYPPLFHLLAVSLASVTDSFLLSARLISLISTLLTALLVAVCSFAVTAGSGRQKQISLLASLIAGLSFLQLDYVYMWAALSRVDMLAICLALSGFAVLLWLRCSWLAVFLASMFFVASAFTKQSSIAALMACGIFLLLYNWRKGLSLGMIAGLTGIVLLLLLNHASNGNAWFNLVVANRNEFNSDDLLFYLRLMVRDNWLYVLAALSFLMLKWRVLRSRDFQPRSLVFYYLISSFLVSLTIGKVGSNFNYFIEFLAISCISLGILISDFLMLMQNRRSAISGSEVSLGGHSPRYLYAGITIVTLLLVSSYHTGKYQGHFNLEYRSKRVAMGERDLRSEVSTIQNKRELQSWLVNLPGKVLSEDMTILSKSGKDVYFQPFIMRQLELQALWHQENVVESLLDQEIAAVILLFSLDVAPHYAESRFSPEVLRAIQSRYELSTRYGRYHIYLPKKVSSPGFLYAGKEMSKGMGPVPTNIGINASFKNWRGDSHLDYQGSDTYALVTRLPPGRHKFSLTGLDNYKIHPVESVLLSTLGTEYELLVPEDGVYHLALHWKPNGLYLSAEKSPHLIFHLYGPEGKWDLDLLAFDQSPGLEIWHLAREEETFFSLTDAEAFLKTQSPL